MKIRTLLGISAMLVATAAPAVASAQRHRRGAQSYGRTSYGRGPFYPSCVPSPSYRYFGSGRQYRSGGATFQYGPGGGLFGNYPTYYHNSSPADAYGYNRYGSNRRSSRRNR